MSREYKDASMNNLAVKAYRDKFRFTPNRGLRKDIITTVTNLALWIKILNAWRYQTKNRWVGKNPLAVKEMLTEYERLSANAMERKDMQASSTEGISRGRVGRVSHTILPPLLERSGNRTR